METEPMTENRASHLPRLWMVERVAVEKFSIDPKLEVPEATVEACALVFQGKADKSQTRIVFDLLKQVCALKRRLACGCTLQGHLRPEISCRTRPSTQSFLMAKMPSSSKRPVHLPDCPFSRDTKMRIDNVWRTDRSAFGFSGNFVLPVEHGLSVAPPVSSHAGQNQSQLPKLTRMFATLLGQAGFSHLPPGGLDQSSTDIYEQFDRLLRAAKTFNVAPNLLLQRVFSTSRYPKEVDAFKRRVEMRFEKIDPEKQRTGFLALYTTQANGRNLIGPTGEVEVTSEPLLLAGTQQSDYEDTPALSLIAYGAPKAGFELWPHKACIVPVYSGTCFTPVANNMARAALKSLLSLRRYLHSRHPEMVIDIEVPPERVFLGSSDLPDFIISGINQETGLERTVYGILVDDRHKRQAEARDIKVADWRKTPGLAVVMIDEDGLDKPLELQAAIAACLGCVLPI